MSDLFKNSIVLSAMLFGMAAPCLSAKITDAEAAVERASLLCKDGQIEQAIELQTEILNEKPGNWQAHATMSYLRWQTGDVVQAVAEGRAAARLEPHHAQIWLNLGHMHQCLDEFDRAISAYKSAARLSPDDWAPQISLAKAFMRTGRAQEALRIIGEMIEKKNQSYKWYHEAGECGLAFDEPLLAEQAADCSLQAAKSSAEKEAGSVQLFTALLRGKQFSKAGQIKDYIFSACEPKDFELYVRAADGLYTPKEVMAIKPLFEAASKSLQASEDAEGFFRLGRVCQQKSLYVLTDATEYGAWLEVAKACYTRAVELSPQQSRYHLALAGVASATGQTEIMQKSLSEARSVDPYDSLAAFLLERRLPSGITNLSKVHFQMDGLTCGCQLTHFNVGLSKIDGVAFVDTPHEQPYRGTMFIDLSKCSAEDAFKRCHDKIRSSRPDLKIPDVKFTALSTQAVSRVDDVIRIALNYKCGDVLRFDGQFRPTVPDMPVVLVADKSTKLQ